eukprot:GHVT01020306.1.p1 GENE.GHVT01020306.1~~GHVT01020306.1.p1  ORF type:complete len:967 (+),score=103.76 GHVT01020306.1:474-3374(+)
MNFDGDQYPVPSSFMMYKRTGRFRSMKRLINRKIKSGLAKRWKNDMVKALANSQLGDYAPLPSSYWMDAARKVNIHFNLYGHLSTLDWVGENTFFMDGQEQEKIRQDCAKFKDNLENPNSEALQSVRFHLVAWAISETHRVVKGHKEEKVEARDVNQLLRHTLGIKIDVMGGHIVLKTFAAYLLKHGVALKPAEEEMGEVDVDEANLTKRQAKAQEKKQQKKADKQLKELLAWKPNVARLAYCYVVYLRGLALHLGRRHFDNTEKAETDFDSWISSLDDLDNQGKLADDAKLQVYLHLFKLIPIDEVKDPILRLFNAQVAETAVLFLRPGDLLRFPSSAVAEFNAAFSRTEEAGGNAADPFELQNIPDDITSLFSKDDGNLSTREAIDAVNVFVDSNKPIQVVVVSTDFGVHELESHISSHPSLLGSQGLLNMKASSSQLHTLQVYGDLAIGDPNMPYLEPILRIFRNGLLDTGFEECFARESTKTEFIADIASRIYAHATSIIKGETEINDITDCFRTDGTSAAEKSADGSDDCAEFLAWIKKAKPKPLDFNSAVISAKTIADQWEVAVDDSEEAKTARFMALSKSVEKLMQPAAPWIPQSLVDRLDQTEFEEVLKLGVVLNQKKPSKPKIAELAVKLISVGAKFMYLQFLEVATRLLQSILPNDHKTLFKDEFDCVLLPPFSDGGISVCAAAKAIALTMTTGFQRRLDVTALVTAPRATFFVFKEILLREMHSLAGPRIESFIRIRTERVRSFPSGIVGRQLARMLARAALAQPFTVGGNAGTLDSVASMSRDGAKPSIFSVDDAGLPSLVPPMSRMCGFLDLWRLSFARIEVSSEHLDNVRLEAFGSAFAEVFQNHVAHPLGYFMQEAYMIKNSMFFLKEYGAELARLIKSQITGHKVEHVKTFKKLDAKYYKLGMVIDQREKHLDIQVFEKLQGNNYRARINSKTPTESQEKRSDRGRCNAS